MTDNPTPNNVFYEFRQENIGRYFLRASRLYADLALEKLARYDHPAVSMTHLTIIRHIDIEGTRSTQIAERCSMTKQAIGQSIVELEANNYLVKIPDPNDGRAQLITFTAKGLKFLEDARQIKLDIEAEFATILGKDQFDHILITMNKLLEHYQPD